MKMRLKEKDVFIAKKYDSINKSFFGKITIKLIGEIVLACFIECAVYLGSILYSDISATYVENKKLGRIYISISDKYIEEQFRIPYISFSDAHDLTNHFFMLKDTILRTVSDDNKVIAYFITATNEKRRIPVDSFETEKRVLGSTTQSDLEFYDSEIEANVATNGRYCYYVEMQSTGRYGMFNCYLYGNASYGILSDEIISLICGVASGDVTNDEVSVLRQKAKPDTFGVVEWGYEDKIGILPLCDEWENMYHLLMFKH